MSNIFCPDNLSPQGFLNDLILSQMKSGVSPFSDSPEQKGLNSVIYGYDFNEKLKGKLFYLHPEDRNVFIQNILPTTPKTEWFLDDYFMRKYVNFLNNMTPVQQAALVPYIRLYVKQFENDEFIRTKEIVFNREYKIPNAPQGSFAGGGRGNAGIESLNVEKDFQYYGYVNRYNVRMDFVFDSFDTFANGMQYDNFAGALGKTGNLWGQDQGSGYLSLIKKGSEISETSVFREYLVLEYGYKFPETISDEIINQEDRYIFEKQEKKELRIDCYKHDFKFSETGEVKLSVSYVASSDSAIASRGNDKTNDVFLISNKGIISEIMDEPSEEGVEKLKILDTHKSILLKMEENNARRRKLLQTYCPTAEDEHDIFVIDKEIQELNKEIFNIKKSLLDYTYYFFLRYFMRYDSLFTIKLRPIPMEIEKLVLNPCDLTVGSDKSQFPQLTNLSLHKVSNKKKGEKGDYLYPININYKAKINEIINLGVQTTIDSTNTKDETLKEDYIKKKFGSDTPNYDYSNILDPNAFYESYSCYQALQTFTLTRLATQDYFVKFGKKGGKCEDIIKQGQNIATPEEVARTENPAGYNESYGNISFFPLRALIAAAIDFTLDEKEDINNFPIICLETILTDSMGKEYVVNMGDLLVDVDFFREWLIKNFINMEKLDPTLDDFMNAIFHSLVPNILSTGVGHHLKGNHGNIMRQTFDVSKDIYEEKDFFKHLIDSDPNVRKEALTKLSKAVTVASKPNEIKRPLIIFYQESFKRQDDLQQGKANFLFNYGKRKFDKMDDYKAGIYHVLMGQNSGIVKQINFSYMNDPYLNTLFAMKNPNHLAAYMRYSYEASIDFVGNDLFFNKSTFFAIPNNQFNVSQTGIGFNSDKDLFGLSGYYQVTKTTDRIMLGEYTTIVTARNMYSPNLEEAKLKKCKEEQAIENKTGEGQENKFLTYVKHDIGKYIYEAVRDVPLIGSKFNLKIKVEEKK